MRSLIMGLVESYGIPRELKGLHCSCYNDSDLAFDRYCGVSLAYE